MITFPVYKLIEYYRNLCDYTHDDNANLVRALNFIRTGLFRVYLSGNEIKSHFYFVSGVSNFKNDKYKYTVAMKVADDKFMSDGGTSSLYHSYLIDVERPCYFEVPDFDAFYNSIKNFGAFIYSDKEALKLYLTL